MSTFCQMDDHHSNLNPSLQDREGHTSQLAGFHHELLSLGAIFLAFLLVDGLIFSGSKISVQIYQQFSCLWSSLLTYSGVGILALTVLLRWSLPQDRWTALPGQRWLQGIGLVCLFPLIWQAVTHKYNYYWDSAFVIDRCACLLLFILAIFRPSLYLLSLWGGLIVISQCRDPLLFSYTDKMLPLGLCCMVIAHLLMAGLWRNYLPRATVLAGFAVFALFYMAPGLKKLQLNWLLENESKNIIWGAYYQNGWGVWFTPETLSCLAIGMEWTCLILMIFTLIVELGVIFICWNRRVAMGLILGLIFLHLGIFASTGIFFWKWVLVDSLLLMVLLLLSENVAQTLFNRRNGVLVAICICMLLPLYRRPVPLGWYDTRHVHRFQIEMLGQDGQVYEVPPSALAPYDVPFAQGRFYRLTDTKKITDCFGSCDQVEIQEALENMTDPAELITVRDKYGRNRKDDQFQLTFHQLVVRYVQSRKQSPPAWTPLDLLPPPPQHIWTFARGNLPCLSPDVEIVGYQVRLEEAVILQSGMVPVVNQVVAAGDIPMPAARELKQAHHHESGPIPILVR